MANWNEWLSDALRGVEEPQEDLQQYDAVETEEETESKIFSMPKQSRSTASNVLNIKQPLSFEDAREICNSLVNKQPTIVNLENITRELAQRIIDFVSGAIYSLDGEIQKISSKIFIVTPKGYTVEDGIKDNDQEKIEKEETNSLRFIQ